MSIAPKFVELTAAEVVLCCSNNLTKKLEHVYRMYVGLFLSVVGSIECGA